MIIILFTVKLVLDLNYKPLRPLQDCQSPQIYKIYLSIVIDLECTSKKQLSYNAHVETFNLTEEEEDMSNDTMLFV